MVKGTHEVQPSLESCRAEGKVVSFKCEVRGRSILGMGKVNLYHSV